jgi:hypothetical protein
MEWPLKDEELMKKEEMEHFYEIAKSTGVKNPQWSGMTKRVESDMDSSSKNKETTLPKC